MKFTAIDVETANAGLSSICQIGLATFEGGKHVKSWSSLVDPNDYFDAINVSIHGITESMVRGKPRFEEVCSKLNEELSGEIVVSHTAFDRSSITSAYRKTGLDAPDLTWLDSAKVVRRTWSQFSSSGYGLSSVAAYLNIKFSHHDALEDARAAGEILVAALSESGIEVSEWLVRSNQRIGSRGRGSDKITREGNGEGPLFGEKVVFTGALVIPRREIADIAANAGCEVLAGVTKKTTLLVVGDQDVSKLAGHSKSSKHRKAEELIAKGRGIRILRESDLMAMLESADAG